MCPCPSFSAESQVPDFILFRALEVQVIIQRESVSSGLESRKECISIFVTTEFPLLIINIGLCLKPLSLASTIVLIVFNVKGSSDFGIANIHSSPEEGFRL